MIKNERQYKTTKEQAAKFASALSFALQHPEERDHLDPILRSAEEASMRTILKDLRAELREYEELSEGRKRIFRCTSFFDLPRALIKARIASKLTQEQLAERLGVKKQQVQHYEATKFAGASFARLAQTIEALDLNVRLTVALPDANIFYDVPVDVSKSVHFVVELSEVSYSRVMSTDITSIFEPQSGSVKPARLAFQPAAPTTVAV